MSFPGPFSQVVGREDTPHGGVLLKYGEGRKAHVPAPTDRGYKNRTARKRTLYALRTVFDGAAVRTPDFPHYKPTRRSSGDLVVVRMMRCKYEDNKSEMFVEVRCKCGTINAIQASYWRTKPPSKCPDCAKGRVKQMRFARGYNVGAFKR